KFTDPDHPDYAALQESLGQVVKIADQVNEAVRRKERRDKLMEVRSRLTGAVPASLVAPLRVHVREGSLTKLCRKKPKPRHFVLMSDLLLYGVETMGGGCDVHNVI